jgi:glucokinase
MTIGTGIGGGLVIDGKIFRGANNAAGEIGHTTVGLDANFTCGCGKNGHLESIASWTAFNKLCSGSGPLMRYDEIIEAVESGNQRVQTALNTFQNALQAGFQNIIYSYNPDAIVLGGGVAGYPKLWLPAAKKALNELIYSDLQKTEILESNLGDTSNAIGAAMLCTNC